MTTFERFERAIPELMTELSPARVPDYFDDMLQQTAATRQRPAWSSLERWIPVGVIAKSVPLRPFPWRQLAVLALLGLLIGAGLVAYVVGSPPRLPAPYGLARNGQVAFSTADGDIAAIDPATGTITSLISGPTQDIAPWFSPDGRRFVFVRTVPDGEAYFVANADGSDVRELVAPQVDWTEWSPGSDRIVVRHSVRGQGVASVVDVESGALTPIDVGLDIQQPVWRPNHDQIVFASETSGERLFYLVDSDGTDIRTIDTAAGVVNLPSLSPDGEAIAYATWEAGVPDREGRIHVIGIDEGGDRELTLPGSSGSTELGPIFSPDGRKLLIERYEAAGGYRLIIAPIDGNKTEIALGESRAEFTNGASAMWSPDGTFILVTYNDDQTTWLYAADGTSAQQVTWTTSGALTWQRLAP